MTTQIRPEQANLTKYWDFGSGTMRVPSGTGFPAAPNDGDVFYRTDEDLLYIYDGAAWESWLVHDVVGAGHTTVGAQWDVVGLTGINTLGLLTPSADVSAGAEAILKSTAAGDLALHDLTATGQLSAGAGIAEGIILGADAQWYRSAANMLRTPDSVTIDVGLNVGTTGAGTGDVFASGILSAGHALNKLQHGGTSHSDTATIRIPESGVITGHGGHLIQISGDCDESPNYTFTVLIHVLIGRTYNGGSYPYQCPYTVLAAHGIEGNNIKTPSVTVTVSGAGFYIDIGLLDNRGNDARWSEWRTHWA